MAGKFHDGAAWKAYAADLNKPGAIARRPGVKFGFDFLSRIRF